MMRRPVRILVVLLTVHPNADLSWLDDCEDVLDCTYRTAPGRRRHLHEAHRIGA